MLHHRLFLLIAVCLSVLSLSPIAAQDETPTETINVSGQLIYVQEISNQGGHFIGRNSSITQTYTVDPNKCSNISQNGTYIATSSMQTVNLSIIRFDTQQTILQIPWSTNWKPCDLYWISDTVLSISDPASSTKHYHIDIPSGQITIYDPPPYVEPTYPQLPNWMSQNPVLFSPDGSKVLYEECPSNLVISNSDGIYCRKYPDWVIYDTVAQLNKVHITDINGSSYQAYDFFAAAAWSPNGRYLAYLQQHNFPLRIFDTVTNQYLDTTGLADIPVDERKGLYWSPDGTKVAMWAVGRMAEPEPGDDKTTVRQLIFFDTTKTDSTKYVLPDRVDNIAKVTYQPGIWSPDSQAFAYVNAENSLIYVTVSSGVTSLLDNNVPFIITWKVYTPLPPTATTTKQYQIVYTASLGDTDQIFVMNANGANTHQLTTFGPYGRYNYVGGFSSINNRFILVTQQDLGYATQISTMNTDGSNIIQLTNEADYNSKGLGSWSPDGNQIVFSSDVDNVTSIYKMNVNGTNVIRLTFNVDTVDYSPKWSPTGNRIAYQSGEKPDIYTMNTDGTNQVRLTNNASSNASPDWSPDGSHIAFTSDREGNEDVFVMNADGSNIINLTNSPGIDREPAWSPDGTQIAFTSNRDGNLEIYVMNVDGTNQTRLTNNTNDDSAPIWFYISSSQAATPTAEGTSIPISIEINTPVA